MSISGARALELPESKYETSKLDLLNDTSGLSIRRILRHADYDAGPSPEAPGLGTPPALRPL